MLTAEHAIVNYDQGRARPDRLSQRQHGHYLRHAESMLDIYLNGLGMTRQALHRAVQMILEEEPDCPTRRIEAFCKLLDDASEFDTDPKGKAPALRREVFRRAARMHPLVSARDRLFEHAESDVKNQIASELGTTWEDIDHRLFSDVAELHTLRVFHGYADARALLSRYNVAQTQAALYRAVRLSVWAREDFRTILRQAKLARLLHRITWEPASREYRIDLDGPASVLRETRRYGVAMAGFLPALLACRGWRLTALIQTNRGGWKCRLDLSPKDGLQSHLPEPEDFDSEVEAGFAKKWGPGRREGWQLVREGEILHAHQRVFVPDFTLRHEDGREVLLEIVGFWTPEYLQAKAETLRHFSGRRILLAIPEATAADNPELAAGAILYKTALKLKDVLDRLNQIKQPDAPHMFA